MSEPEASERGSSLIGKKLHYKGIQSLFLSKRKELWLCATQRFRMRNGLARNCGEVRMEDLGCAVDSQGIVWLCWNGRFRMLSRLPGAFLLR